MGFELQFQNERVRVSRWTLHEHEETGQHRHDYDYVIVPVLDAQIATRDADGLETARALEGGVAYFRDAGVEHNVRNPSPGLLEFVEVELLQ